MIKDSPNPFQWKGEDTTKNLTYDAAVFFSRQSVDGLGIRNID